MNADFSFMEIALLFILGGIAFFNMPYKDYSPEKNKVCAMIGNVFLIYLAYFLVKNFLIDNFSVAGEWSFTTEKIWAIVEKIILAVFVIVAGVFIGANIPHHHG